jgi:hypothetical protein
MKTKTITPSQAKSRRQQYTLDAAARRMGYPTWKSLASSVYSVMLPSGIGQDQTVPTEDKVLKSLTNIVYGMASKLDMARMKSHPPEKDHHLDHPAADLQEILIQYPRIQPGRKINQKKRLGTQKTS